LVPRTDATTHADRVTDIRQPVDFQKRDDTALLSQRARAVTFGKGRS